MFSSKKGGPVAELIRVQSTRAWSPSFEQGKPLNPGCRIRQLAATPPATERIVAQSRPAHVSPTGYLFSKPGILSSTYIALVCISSTGSYQFQPEGPKADRRPWCFCSCCSSRRDLGNCGIVGSKTPTSIQRGPIPVCKTRGEQGLTTTTYPINVIMASRCARGMSDSLESRLLSILN